MSVDSKEERDEWIDSITKASVSLVDSDLCVIVLLWD